MTTIELSHGCKRWQAGDATMHSPADIALLDAITRAGFLAFVGPSGLCGGKSETRSVIAIHRGRGTKWELVFREQETDVISTTTTDLSQSISILLSWLQGKSLLVDENSLRAIAG